jgi:hypothetical protein
LLKRFFFCGSTPATTDGEDASYQSQEHVLDASGNVMKAMRACRHLATDQAIDGGKQPLSLFDYEAWTMMVRFPISSI